MLEEYDQDNVYVRLGISLSSPEIFLLTVPRRCFFCGSPFLLFCLSLPYCAAWWSPVGKGLNLCVMFSCVFCHFHIWCPGSGMVLNCVNS